MNVTVSLLAKECSVSALIPAGLVKDVTAVICETGLLGETVVAQQHISFFSFVCHLFCVCGMPESLMDF